MARLFSSGFELGSNTIGIEGVNYPNAIGQGVSTNTVRTGTYSLRLNPSSTAAAATVAYIFTNQTANVIYARGYVNIASFPTSTTSFYLVRCESLSGTSLAAGIKINSSHQLQLFNAAGAQVGSNSTALTTGTWYRIELKTDATSSPGTIEGLLNGVSFASGANSSQVANAQISWLTTNGFSNSYDVYLDDIAINDSTGSLQNSYPGAGQIMYQNAAGPGDSTQWTIAGSSPAATNWQSVSESPPDEAVTLVNESTLNKSDFYTVSASPLGVNDTVNAVAVAVRYNNDVADATTAFQAQLKKVTGGTIVKSSAITANDTSWRTTANAISRSQDPDNINWTQSTINSMQIGILAGVVGAHKMQVTKVWTIIDYIPGVVPAIGPRPINASTTPANRSVASARSVATNRTQVIDN